MSKKNNSLRCTSQPQIAVEALQAAAQAQDEERAGPGALPSQDFSRSAMCMKAMLEEAFACGTRPPELLKLAEQMRNMAQQANGQFPPTETEWLACSCWNHGLKMDLGGDHEAGEKWHDTRPPSAPQSPQSHSAGVRFSRRWPRIPY